MNHEIAHLGIVDRHLRLLLPDRMRRGIVRVDADNVDLAQVLEGDVLDVFQLAAQDEVKKLLFSVSCSRRLSLHQHGFSGAAIDRISAACSGAFSEASPSAASAPWRISGD